MTEVSVNRAEENHLLTKHASILAQLSEEKQTHFLYLLDQLLACYTTETSRALLLTMEGAGDKEQMSLVAINADPQETDELIDTLCVFRKLDFQDVVQVM